MPIFIDRGAPTCAGARCSDLRLSRSRCRLPLHRHAASVCDFHATASCSKLGRVPLVQNWTDHDFVGEPQRARDPRGAGCQTLMCSALQRVRLVGAFVERSCGSKGHARPVRFIGSARCPEIDRVAVRVIVDSYQFAVAPSWKVTNVDIGHFGWGIGSDNPPNPVVVNALADSTVRQREFRAASSQRGHFPRYWTLRAKHQIFVTNCHTRSIVYNARTVALNLATGHRRDTPWDAPYPPPVADPAVPLAPPKWWGFFCLSSYAFLRRRRESNFLEAPTPR